MTADYRVGGNSPAVCGSQFELLGGQRVERKSLHGNQYVTREVHSDGRLGADYLASSAESGSVPTGPAPNTVVNSVRLRCPLSSRACRLPA